MRFDSISVSRHRWFVVMIMLVGALNVLLAGGAYYLLRKHIGGMDLSRLGEAAAPIIAEVDYRMALGGMALLCFTLGVFLFFVAVAVDISFRQKAIINLLVKGAARQRSQRAGEGPDEAGAQGASDPRPAVS